MDPHLRKLVVVVREGRQTGRKKKKEEKMRQYSIILWISFGGDRVVNRSGDAIFVAFVTATKHRDG